MRVEGRRRSHRLGPILVATKGGRPTKVSLQFPLVQLVLWERARRRSS